jgi:hypothetical protein
LFIARFCKKAASLCCNICHLKFTNSIIALLIAGAINAQGLKLNAGLYLQFGTHINAVGARFNGHFVQNNIVGLVGADVTYNYKNLGAPGPWWQAKLSGGIAAGFLEATQQYESNRLSRTTNVPLVNDARMAYVYHYYADTRGTSQASASIKIAYKHLELVGENDAFAFLHFDRYRTGGIALSYVSDTFIIGIKSILWTGFSNKAPRLTSEAGQKYVDIAAAPFGKYSHGIYALQVGYAMPFQQYISVHIGLDDEAVRDVLQNKLVHAFVNKKQQSIVPQLDANGNSRISNKQRKKQSRFFGQIGFGGLEMY